MEDVDSGVFPLSIFDMHTKERYTHPTEQDHVGVVTAVTANAALECFATAALDGTIKIWTEENALLVQLDLHDAISACTFLNPHGNLGIGVQCVPIPLPPPPFKFSIQVDQSFLPSHPQHLSFLLVSFLCSPCLLSWVISSCLLFTVSLCTVVDLLLSLPCA